MWKDLLRYVGIFIHFNFKSSSWPLFDFACMFFSQKDVDLSKDDLLGDILQDLHSEVGAFSLHFDA